jgi:hypothetical protein
MTFQRVVQDDIQVMYTAEAGDPGDVAHVAFQRLESALDSLRGRRMYGLYFPDAGEYWASTALLEGDDPEALGFERGAIPGGSYLRARLRGELEELYPRIPTTFSEMVETGEADSSRPSIEFYRRDDEVVLLLPIVEGE